MRSCKLFLLVVSLLGVLALCTLSAGCTSVKDSTQPPALTPAPKPAGIEPEITAVITTGPVLSVKATEPIRRQASDTEFLAAMNASQKRILDQLNTINMELAKDGTHGGASPEYTALGSYARRFVASIDEEITAMSQFREISDPANESRKAYYVNYLNQLKPFASNLELGAGLAQKKDFSTAMEFFSNAKNDLSLVRSQELPGQLTVITRITENLGPFIDVIQQKT